MGPWDHWSLWMSPMIAMPKSRQNVEINSDFMFIGLIRLVLTLYSFPGRGKDCSSIIAQAVTAVWSCDYFQVNIALFEFSVFWVPVFSIWTSLESLTISVPPFLISKKGLLDVCLTSYGINLVISTWWFQKALSFHGTAAEVTRVRLEVQVIYCSNSVICPYLETQAAQFHGIFVKDPIEWFTPWSIVPLHHMGSLSPRKTKIDVLLVSLSLINHHGISRSQKDRNRF